VLVLPEKMNLSTHYEETALYFIFIRKMAEFQPLIPSPKAYRLRSVSFDDLIEISSSAALLLTAELSKWNDQLRSKLKPNTTNWDPSVLSKLQDLGFFRLFSNSLKSFSNPTPLGNVRFVPYIKRKCKETNYSSLRASLTEVIGNPIERWTFLHSGIDEAITNVTHHAYPVQDSDKDSNWYLTGAYDSAEKTIKIVFFDQGIGIPDALPSSKLKERIYEYISTFPPAEGFKDAAMIKAAMEVDRTGTLKSDRGKGLPDMKKFIERKGSGYLSIISKHGLYKFTVNGENFSTETMRFETPINGTLILWKAAL